MKIAVVGGGINGLCSAWQLARLGHDVTLFERDTLMGATSRSSSKLLHGGLRYLENGELGLVREGLAARDEWIRAVPALAKPLRLTLPIYRHSRRRRLKIGTGLFLYDRLAGKSILPGSRWVRRDEMLARDADLAADGLLGGYEFSDGQMDDVALGAWVADAARDAGVAIRERAEVRAVQPDGTLRVGEETMRFDRVVNIAGPWAGRLLEQSGVACPYKLDLVRGSHLILEGSTPQAYFLEIPGERRIFFVLPWKGNTLVGTTEVRQSLDEPIRCSEEEQAYLLSAYRHYFPLKPARIVECFAGVRPLVYGSGDETKTSREYAIHRADRLITVMGGKWTTSLTLARKINGMVR